MIDLNLYALTADELAKYVGNDKIFVIEVSKISRWNITSFPTRKGFSTGILEALFLIRGHPEIISGAKKGNFPRLPDKFHVLSILLLQ